MKTEKNQQPK